MKYLFYSCLLFLFSCKSAPVKNNFEPIPFERYSLENGLEIYAIRDSSLPRLSVALLLKSGSASDPAELSGLNSMMMSALDQGTRSKTAEQISDEFNFYGSELSQSPGMDSSTVSFSALSKDQEPLLKLYAEVLFQPSFPQKEIDRLRSEALASLQRVQDQPGTFVAWKSDETLFPNHPYGMLGLGTAQTLKKISRKDIVDFYPKIFSPDRAALFVSGDVTDKTIETIKKLFGSWKKSSGPILQRLVPLENGPSKIILYSKKGLAQTQIRISHRSVNRQSSEFIPFRLGLYALGGPMSSRLMQRIRNDLGLTYSISSSIESRAQSGVLKISTSTRHEKVKETISEILKLVDVVRNEGVLESEKQEAQTYFATQFPSAIQTADQISLFLENLMSENLPLSYLADFPANYEKVSLKEVNQALAENLKRETNITVYSDGAAVEAQLRSLGLPLQVIQVK